MMFRVSVNNIKPLIQRLGLVQSAFRSESLWAKVGAFLKSQILARTARGVDAEEQAFTPYSESHAMFRRERGRPVGKVNLFWSGTMLSSMDYAPTSSGVRLYFLPTEAPSIRPKKTGGKPKISPPSPLKAYFLQHHDTTPREFFAFNKTDVEKIVKMILSRIN